MSDTRVKKFDKLLGEQVVSREASMPAVSAHTTQLVDLNFTLHAIF